MTSSGVPSQPHQGDGKRLYLCPAGTPDIQETARHLGSFGYAIRLIDDLPALFAAASAAPPAAVLVDCGALGHRRPDAAKLAALRDLAARLPLVCLSPQGDIEARLDAVRMGCRAYFTRPLDIANLLDTLDRLTAPSLAEAGKVLIVEDSPSLAAFYSAQLTGAGFVVQAVTDPMKTLEALADAPPELILLDMNMPGASGQELARVIRQQDAYLSVPIVFLSAESDVGRQREAMSLGGDEFLQKPIEPAHLVSAVRSRIVRYRALRALMVRDSLTGLLNHSSFKERLRAEVARARRQNKPLTVAMIDIDRFKSVNDSHGHPVGDRVIRNLSRLLRQRLRGADVIGRYGGEEFAIVLADTASEAAVGVIESIRENFAAIEHQAGEVLFRCTFSAGLAQCPPCADGESLLMAADAALYQSKRAGRNRTSLAPAQAS